jgi:hypothetical protein
LIYFDVKRERYIVAHQLEARMLQEMRDVLPRAGVEVIYAQNVLTGFDQPLA